MAKTYCHSLLSGSSWASFDGCSLQEEPEAMEVDENNGAGLTEATRLRREEMTLFGLCPDQEEVCLISCTQCGRVVKASAIARHSECFHGKDVLRDLTPSPEYGTLSPMPDPVKLRTKAPTILKGLEHGIQLKDVTVKLEEVPLSLPKSNHVLSPSSINEDPLVISTHKKANMDKPVVKKSPRKLVPTREREFDPDKHCGVWVADHQKRCTRSLTCKTHALSLRRGVPGRSKPFDKLLLEHKARVNSEKEQQGLLLKSQTNSTINRLQGPPESRLVCSANSSASKEDVSRSKISGKSLSAEGEKGPDSARRTSNDGISCRVDRLVLNHHPKPMAQCRFGARAVGRGAFVFNRRSDHFRCAVLSMVEKCLNPSHQRKKSTRPAILQRPTMKTIGQPSNHGNAIGPQLWERHVLLFESTGTCREDLIDDNLSRFPDVAVVV